MGEFLALSQSAILLPHSRVQAWNRRQHSFDHYQPFATMPLSLRALTRPPTFSPHICTRQNRFMWGITAGVVSDSKAPTTFAADSAGRKYSVAPDSGGDGNGPSDANGSGGNGGNNDNNNNNGGNEEGSEDDGKDHSKRQAALSMSQKLTLGYAFLVGAGGVMGYLKSGSQKSLIAGGVSASLLYYVYTVLPTNPVFASSVGFILSAGLLGVMGSRFMKSKKVFPAGVVSFVSLVMSGGYLHGILRSVH